MFTTKTLKNPPLFAFSLLFGFIAFISFIQENSDQLQTNLVSVFSILLSIVVLSCVISISCYNLINIFTQKNKTF